MRGGHTKCTSTTWPASACGFFIFISYSLIFINFFFFIYILPPLFHNNVLFFFFFLESAREHTNNSTIIAYSPLLQCVCVYTIFLTLICSRPSRAWKRKRNIINGYYSSFSTLCAIFAGTTEVYIYIYRGIYMHL